MILPQTRRLGVNTGLDLRVRLKGLSADGGLDLRNPEGFSVICVARAQGGMYGRMDGKEAESKKKVMAIFNSYLIVNCWNTNNGNQLLLFHREHRKTPWLPHIDWL